MPAGEDQRPRVRRPGRVFSRGQRNRIAAARGNNTNGEITILRGERDPFPVRRPIRLGGIGPERYGAAVRDAARR